MFIFSYIWIFIFGLTFVLFVLRVSLVVLKFLFLVIRIQIRNWKNEKILVWNFPNIWGLEWVKDTKFGMEKCLISSYWILSDCNRSRTHNHLVHKQTLNHVTKLANSNITPNSSKEFLDIQASIGCGISLKRVRDLIKAYS